MRKANVPRVAAGATIALSMALAACGGGGPKLEVQTLRLTEGAERASNFIDNPPKTKRVQGAPEQASLGDEFVFEYPIVDASRKDIGNLAVTCTITRAAQIDLASTQCVGTATLPGGSLAVTTAGRAGPTIRGAIVGGTGKYEGASGSFTTVRTSQAGAKDVFHVFLPKQ